MIKKLFGGLNITWPKLIIFAVICGVYTGVMAMIPATKDTSFRDISISFEWWILFGIVLIVNSRSPLDSVLKVFVFFLISQPLVYLVQVPFSSDGFGLFRYYQSWFYWTLLTIPMAFAGYYMKLDKWWGLLILSPMLVFVGIHYMGFLSETMSFFPNHLLSALFCAGTLILYPLAVFKDKRIRLAGLAVSLVILVVCTVLALGGKSSYETDVLASGGETSGVEFDDTYQAYLEDESFGEVTIRYEEALECYLVRGSFKKTGATVLTLEAPDGTKYVYDLTVERTSYSITRRSP